MNRVKTASSLVLAVLTAIGTTPAFAHQLINEQVPMPKTPQGQTPTTAPVPATPTFDSQINTQTIPPQSAIGQPPKTAEEITNYLKAMRRNIDTFNRVVGAMFLQPGSSPDAQSIAAASGETERLLNEMQSLIPPREVATQHKQLTDGLTEVVQFLQAGGANADMMRALSLAGSIQGNIGRYHDAVENLISRHNLPNALDPFGGESEAAKQQAAAKAGEAQTNLINNIMGGGGNGSAAAASNPNDANQGINMIFGGGAYGLPQTKGTHTGLGATMSGASGLGGTMNGAGGFTNGAAGLGSIMQGAGGLDGLMNGAGGGGVMNGAGGLGGIMNGAGGLGGIMNGAGGLGGIMNGAGGGGIMNGAGGLGGIMNGGGGLGGIMNGGAGGGGMMNGAGGSGSPVDSVVKQMMGENEAIKQLLDEN